MDVDALVPLIESLREDVRRAARAALAAKAAAEEGARLPSDDAWALGLLPALDGLARCDAAAARLAAEYARPAGSFFRRRPADPRIATLAEAVRMAHDVLEEALAARGFSVERPEGEAFDPTRHRAVDTDPALPPGRVGAVVRAGPRKGDRILREADVVVGRSAPRSGEGDEP